MGAAQPGLLKDAANLVVGQRLTAKQCRGCKNPILLIRKLDQLEEFSEKGVGSVLAEDLGEHLDAAREHLETVAAELLSAGL